MHRIRQQLTAILYDCRQPVPGFEQLPWLTRARLLLQALGLFIVSAQALRLLLYWVIWQLCAYLCVWHLDIRGPLAVLGPPLSALVWVCPWCAIARNQLLYELLERRWPRY